MIGKWYEKMISVVLDIKENLNVFSVTERQIPFAAAKSLTLTAKDAQENVRKHIRDTFVIRKKSGGFESSIAIRPATKTNLQAEVYTMAAFAALQQTGGIRNPKGDRLAIPDYKNIREVGNRRPTANAFSITAYDGHEMLAERKGKSFRILYHLMRKADVPKRLDMIETTIRTVGDRFAMHVGMAVANMGKS